MAGEPAERRDRGGRADELALDAYAVVAGSLNLLIFVCGDAVNSWSAVVEHAGKNTHAEAFRALVCSAEREVAAVYLKATHCFDAAGRFDMAPGTWNGMVAAKAEVMAPSPSLSAARWLARCAPTTESSELPALVEIGASDNWLGIAADMLAAESAAAGTVMEGARPAERTGAGCMAREAETTVRPKAMREDAAGMWMEASTEWSRARDRATGEGNEGIADLAAAQARSAAAHAVRLRAA